MVAIGSEAPALACPQVENPPCPSPPQPSLAPLVAALPALPPPASTPTRPEARSHALVSGPTARVRDSKEVRPFKAQSPKDHKGQPPGRGKAPREMRPRHGRFLQSQGHGVGPDFHAFVLGLQPGQGRGYSGRGGCTRTLTHGSDCSCLCIGHATLAGVLTSFWPDHPSPALTGNLILTAKLGSKNKCRVETRIPSPPQQESGGLGRVLTAEGCRKVGVWGGGLKGSHVRMS